jgi:acetyl-CoA carboxylase carboxyl transferase subunit alpha
MVADVYARLTPWQKTQVARHPARPHFSDYMAALISEFTPLAGDRLYGDDRAIVAGLGQAEAIARSTQACLALSTPFVATIIGEGGSGGAVAIATANKVYMLEHAIYSVISPEGCASILWHKSEKAADAAAAMKITAQDLLELKVIDGIVAEPVGGAHRAPQAAIQSAGNTIEQALRDLAPHSSDDLRRLRRDKFLQIGRLEGA